MIDELIEHDCELCGYPQAVDLGTLGSRKYVRCRGCGMDYFIDDSEEEQDEWPE